MLCGDRVNCVIKIYLLFTQRDKIFATFINMKHLITVTSLIMIVLLSMARSGPLEPPKPLANVEWIAKPKGFQEFKRAKKGAVWENTSLLIFEGKVSIDVGPCYYRVGADIRRQRKEDEVADYYIIEVLEENEIGQTTLASLRIPLAFVEKDRLHKPAKELVRFDKATGIATIDLGNAIFKCQVTISGHS